MRLQTSPCLAAPGRSASTPATQDSETPGRECFCRRLAAAFETLQPRLLATLTAVLDNRDDAGDVLQAAFVNCWQARVDGDAVRDVEAWLWRVALNAATDLQRSAWRRRVRPLGLELDAGPDPRGRCPAEAATEREQLRRLRDAVLRLRSEQRDVFLLRQNDDLTYEEIAEQLSRPVGTVKTQMRAALRRLRGELGGAGEPAAVA